ncbi:molybdenum cofactor guanylyltransferase MobA [Falsirhodobacter sp. alg1]|uniref:molybdenum cofactor guanylyltransferase MobA n=1 Tax=Falsirhodobacter sp. alg1 TaxID=1472418 RepID=UPI0005F08CED|nr:molybdenum cofactor guanylyltransferase MobA [Falsirhodobacter sp. alg1]
MTDPESVYGLILAGGQSRRMGGQDKALLRLGNATLLLRAVARLGPQVRGMAISGNGDPARFADGGLPVLPDAVGGYAGPLAGVLAGMIHARAEGADFLVTAAVDTPFFPQDLVVRLAAAGQAALATSPRGPHPTFALWPVDQEAALRAFLQAGGRRVSGFAALCGAVPVLFAQDDAFFNINHPADLDTARDMARRGAEGA